jgi:MEDS: MEthanogen/methylotroph, DcmR Sensory domain
MSTTTHLTNIPSNEHIMLLYSSDDERNNAAVNYINNGLKSGYQCIYASINAYDSKSSSNISNLSSKIDNYKENIERDELRIVDFKPYYESALNVDFRPFKKLKKELEETLNHRKSEGKKDAILVFADAACFLSQNKHFDECEILEWWWNETTTEWKQNNQNITVVCPHPELVINNPILSLDTKGRLNGMHTITIDLHQSTAENPKRKPKRILIAEPEPDIRLVEISKGLIEMLQSAGFTVEKILEDEPSHIAETLGIDVYVGEIIYNETKKASSNVVNSNSLL